MKHLSPGIEFDGQIFPDAEFDNGNSGAGTVVIDWSKGNSQKITMTGNCLFGAPSNMKAGAVYRLCAIQDATGNRAPTWNSVFKWTNGTPPTLGGANAIDLLAFYCDGTDLYGSNGVGPAGAQGEPGGGSVTKAAAATVAAGADITWLVLAANSSDVTGITLVVVMTMTGVGVGRYHFKCQLIYQATATTTGLNVAVNHTGTTTQFVCEARFTSTGGAAANKTASQAAQGSALGLYESEGTRTKNAEIGTVSNFIVGVDAANSDMILTIEGMFVVSVTGSLEIKISAELAALVVRAMQGSHLELMKLS